MSSTAFDGLDLSKITFKDCMEDDAMRCRYDDYINDCRRESKRLGRAVINRFTGAEILDTTPIAVHVPLSRPLSDYDHIRNIIRTELSQASGAAGYDTFEDADDFDIPDDRSDPLTPYERDFDLAYATAVERGFAKSPSPIPESDKNRLKKWFRKRKERTSAERVAKYREEIDDVPVASNAPEIKSP